MSQVSARDMKEIVTEKILAALEGGSIPWVKPWKSSLHGGASFNGLTDKPYTGGVNTVLLWLSAAANGWQDNRWAGRGQIRDNQWNIKGLKDEVSTTIYAPILKKWVDDDGIERFNLVGFREVQVFNFSQIQDEKVPSLESLQPPPVNPAIFFEKADRIVSGTGAKVTHGGDRAYYSPTEDRIQMPVPGAFNDLESYWATLLHEVTHWTGHKDRLGRFMEGNHGSEAYAFEELVAEMGSAFTCAHVGIDRPQLTLNHAGYIQHWIKILKEDSSAFTNAAGAAWKAHQFIVGK